VTVLERISDALMELGVIGPGDTLDDDDAQLALRHFQRWMDAINADRPMLYTVLRSLFTLTASQQTRTIGSGGNFNVARPVFISHIGVIPVGQDYEMPVVPYIDREEWLAEPWKSQTDLYPSRYLYEPTFPLGTLTFWPVPTTAPQVAVSIPQALTTPALLTTELTFPPGYDLFLHLMLAEAFVRPFKVPLTPDLQKMFEDGNKAKGTILRNNDPGPPPAQFDLSGGRYDIRSGSYRK
jgi:hypothetical protein